MKFSIIIPSFNRANHLPNAIESVLSQTFTDWELIIVDDGSTDNTKEVVASYKDSRLRYIYQSNSERSAARNKGIDNADGEWICFLDSDDEYVSDHLYSIAEYIEKVKPSLGLIATGLMMNNEKKYKKKDLLNLQNNILIEIGEKFLIPTQVCVHRSILEKENFDTRFRLWEDTHLWLRIAAQYPVYQIEQYSAIQNIHNEGTVVQGMKNVRLEEMNQYILAINDLQNHSSDQFKNKLPEHYFLNYKTSKYKMYLYQARQNKQIAVALKIWGKALKQQPSWYLLTELPKIFMNRLGLGIHD